MEQWITALKTHNAQDRVNAAMMLGQMGAKAKDAVPALIGILRDQDAC